MMQVTEANFESVMAQEKGFLVNVWPRREAKAHVLAHLHGACKRMLAPVPEYPKFYADTLEEAVSTAQTQYSVECSECTLCKKAEPARSLE